MDDPPYGLIIVVAILWLFLIFLLASTSADVSAAPLESIRELLFLIFIALAISLLHISL